MIMVLKYGNFLAVVVAQAVEQLLPVQAGRVQIPVQTLVYRYCSILLYSRSVLGIF